MKSKFKSDYTNQEIEGILEKADKKPFVLYFDEQNALYKFFATEEDKEAYEYAQLYGEMTSEIESLPFTGSFVAPAPNTIDFYSVSDNKFYLEGQTGISLSYQFGTTSNSKGPIYEAIDAYYTFKSPSGTKQATYVYDAGTTVNFIIDDYLSLGVNSITIMIKGRSTTATKTTVVTYTISRLKISSTFNIAKTITYGQNFNVNYHVESGSYKKYVHFYIDGAEDTDNMPPDEIKAKDTDIDGQKIIINSSSIYKPGKHTLEIQATITVDQKDYNSNLLYYEYIITGEAENGQTEYIMLSYDFPNDKTKFSGIPKIDAEQYMTTVLNWAYYSSNPYNANVEVQWRLVNTKSGSYTPVASRTAEYIDTAESSKTPDPIYFVPTIYTEGDNTYALIPYIRKYGSSDQFNAVLNTQYDVDIEENTNGISEKTAGLMLKLTAIGRSNDEPDAQLSSWTYSGRDANGNAKEYTTEFSNQPWTGNSGWNSDALWLNNGATAYIDCMPFSSEVGATDSDGATFEIEFETFNIDNDDATVVQIGTPSSTSPSLVITGNTATITSFQQATVSTKFLSDEKIKLTFIICPNENQTNNTPRMMYIINNGVITAAYPYNSGNSDNFNIDSGIYLGNASGKCGIKIYSIRSYNTRLNMYEALNNYIVDSGTEMQSLVAQNDIYSSEGKVIDISKLESLCTTVEIVGAMSNLIGKGTKNKITAKLQIKCPSDPSINLSCLYAQIGNAGQSTLDLPVPSLHVKLDKNNNICYDRDGKKIEPLNRWRFNSSSVPEKKFRLQCNYMDSSGCNNGAFLKMYNQVQKKVKVNNEYVLRTPIQNLIYDTSSNGYSAKMQALYGDDTNGTDWAFPYTINVVPDSMPCVVVWKENDDDDFEFLGQYVIMEEKNANYSNGMHSVYANVTSEGKADPFRFYTSGGTRLWNNLSCYQFEIQRNDHELTLFTGRESWNDWNLSANTPEREYAFEMEFPDEDDLTNSQKDAAWDYFFNGFVKPVCDTYNDYDAFDKLYGTVLDKWHFAAYYTLVLRNGCVDSTVRNMEITTYDGVHWLPKWWDVDMQCGLEQTGVCDVEPCSVLSDYIGEGTNKHYLYAGKTFETVDTKTGKVTPATSSWLWDALEHNKEFQQAVATIDGALYDADWTYENITQIQDEQFIDTWSESLYNESSKYKYIDQYYENKDHLGVLLGSMKSRRHWFLKTSYDYYDAKNVCGTYKSSTIYLRVNGAESGTEMKFTAGATTFFGWGLTDSAYQTGVKVQKGTDFSLYLNISIDSKTGLNDPIKIYSASKLTKVDLSNFAAKAINTVQFENTYDSITGSILKELNFGVPKDQMALGVSNNADGLKFSGLNTMSRLQIFNIQGLQCINNVDLTSMLSLTEFYAAGSGLTQFYPADGVQLTVVELPTSVMSITMDGGSLTNKYKEGKVEKTKCAITWWNTVKSDGDKYITSQADGISTNLMSLSFSGMGQDIGTHLLVIEWLHAIRDAIAAGDESVKWSNYKITYNQVNWTDMSLDDLRLLAKIPVKQRTISGYIKVTSKLNSEIMSELINSFDKTIFTKSSRLVIDCESDTIMVSASGENVTVQEITPEGSKETQVIINVLQGYSVTPQAVGFPIISTSTPKYEWSVKNTDELSYHMGSKLNPTYKFDGNTIHYSTGYITTIEQNLTYGTDLSCKEYDIKVLNNASGDGTGPYGTATLKIINRTYPEYAYISLDMDTTRKTTAILGDVYQILESGTYTFTATHTYYDSKLGKEVSDYTGTMNDDGAEWTVLTGDGEVPNSEYVKIKSHTNTTLVIEVSTDFDDDTLNLKIGYTSTWKNYKTVTEDSVTKEYGTKLTAKPISVDVVKIIQRVLVDNNDPNYGNDKLFDILERFGYTHLCSTYYTSYELKNIVYEGKKEKDQIDFYNLISAMKYDDYMETVNDDNPFDQRVLNRNINNYVNSFTSLSSTVYNIPYFLKSIRFLNLSACSGLTDVDIVGASNYRGLNLQDTNINASLGEGTSISYIKYGSPSFIKIEDPDQYLDSSSVTIQNVSRLSSIELSNLVKLTDDDISYDDSYFNNEFKVLADIVDLGKQDGQTIENLKHIDIVDTIGLNWEEQNIEKYDTGHEIESVASLLSTARYPDRDQLDDTSYMKLHVITKYAYADEVAAILKKFPDMVIDTSFNYYRWLDREFEKAISEKREYGGFGDGTGITTQDADDIDRIKNILQNNDNIRNLRDLSVCASLIMPDQTAMENSDFYGCTGIEQITFPAKLNLIGRYTFNGLSNLYYIDFTNCTQLTSINEYSFQNCSHTIDIDISKCPRLQVAYLNGFTNLGTVKVQNEFLTKLVL